MEGLLTNPLTIVVVLVVLFLISALRVYREYERATIFLLGRFWKVKGPGLIIVIPIIQQAVRVDLRTVVLDIPAQEVITQDNVSTSVSAVLYYRVIEAERAVIQVEEYHEATTQLAQTTLRSVLGKHDLDDLLAQRDKLNADIQDILDSQTEAWGIKVSNVEIKHVEIAESMVRAIAKQAEAERERRAKVIHAEGEQQAAEKLVDTAAQMEEHPGALQLRYLQTLTEVATENNSTTLFPIPMDLLQPFQDWLAGKQEKAQQS
ncbi:slipin family protein [Thiohalorhabdus sp.]|uniref:slipin family protein n=1 Tax=Thiohalorhabdus sp. TaxID=3094134 RepID=UPI002FC31A3D